MERKIVVDSSADLRAMSGISFASVPLKILAGSREFVDDSQCDVMEMVEYLRHYKERTSTACPGVGEYVEAFGDADEVFCITITSNLSGSYNAASIAAQAWAEQHPAGKIHVFDSLSAGPEMALLAEKLQGLIGSDLSFEKIVAEGNTYLATTRLAFSLESLHNLAVNGRVPMVVAKAVGVLGLRLIGQASEQGTLQPTGKARGEKKVVPELMKKLLSLGYRGGKLRISHCCNLPAAQELEAAVKAQFPDADVQSWEAGALVSFYAEAGGLLIGLETA